MQKQTIATPGNDVHHTPMQYASEFGSRALDAVHTGATRAAHSTEKTVRRYPLAAVGIAFGGGAILGMFTYRMLTSRHPAQ